MLARVIIGESCVGYHKLEIPEKPGSFRKYDSMVNNIDNPEIFVISSDFQAYPEFIVTVKIE